MITPQTNSSLNDIAQALLECDNIYICGHQNPDGDCLGSTLGLFLIMKELGKNVTPLYASGIISKELRTIPCADCLIEASDICEPCNTFVMLDASHGERMSPAAVALFNQAKLTITVDHHAHDERVSMLSYTDPDAPATCTLIWELAKLLLGKPSQAIAQCCYDGTLTDTGCFKFQNATEEAFRLASEMIACGADPYFASQTLLESRTESSLRLESICIQNMIIDEEHGIVSSTFTKEDFEKCNAEKSDVDPLVQTLRTLDTIRVVVLLYEQEEGIRVSMRSKDDTDVAKIAKLHGGGGHKAASGCTMYGDIFECRDTLVRDIIQETCVS